jgi:hypothetical protein
MPEAANCQAEKRVKDDKKPFWPRSQHWILIVGTIPASFADG